MGVAMEPSNVAVEPSNVAVEPSNVSNPLETDPLETPADIVGDIKPGPFLCSTRCRICVLVGTAFALLYMHRVNLSVAIICMVKHTERTHDHPTRTRSQAHTNFTIHSNYTSSNGHTNYSTIGHSNYTIDVYSHNQFNGSTKLVDIGRFADLDIATTPSSLKEGVTDTPDMTCVKQGNVPVVQEWTPELDWGKSQTSILLSSYFFGSFFTQVPAGTLADKLGGKHIITVTMFVTAVCSLLTPVCARTSIVLVFVLRILIGLAGGAVIPVCYSMLNSWVTPAERASMIAFSSSGLHVGSILSYLTSGLLCAYGFDNGWPSIFYIQGVLAVLFTCLWWYEAASSPAQHRGISKTELMHISMATVNRHKCKSIPTPWLAIWTSKPMWATLVAHFTFNWSFFTILITGPLFMEEVLKFDIKQNGALSTLPNVFLLISANTCAKLSTLLINKRVLGVLATRRIFTCFCLGGNAICLLATGHVSCSNRYLGVVLICLSSFCGGAAYAGLFVNHGEYAGKFLGTAFGITNAAGVISSLVASMLAGLLTPDGTQEQWQVVFYIASGLNVFGALIFVLWSSASLEPWAVKHEQVLEIVVEEPHKQSPSDL